MKGNPLSTGMAKALKVIKTWKTATYILPIERIDPLAAALEEKIIILENEVN